MPKTFLTERDIDDMHARGVTSINVTDSTVLTDLAAERAFKYGIELNRAEHQPAPRATYSPSVNTIGSNPIEVQRSGSPDAELIAKVRSMVLARLDGNVDAALLNAVISRVVSAMK